MSVEMAWGAFLFFERTTRSYNSYCYHYQTSSNGNRATPRPKASDTSSPHKTPGQQPVCARTYRPAHPDRNQDVDTALLLDNSLDGGIHRGLIGYIHLYG